MSINVNYIYLSKLSVVLMNLITIKRSYTVNRTPFQCRLIIKPSNIVC